MGEALAGTADELVVATKFGLDMEGTNGERARRLGASMRGARSMHRSSSSGPTHVDLYYYHRPDGVTPLDETLGAMQSS